MSGWVPSYFGGGGRWSPFGRAPPPRTPDVRDSDYAYISQDDIVDPPSGYQGQGSYYASQGGAGYARRREPSDDDPNAPDILIVKYKGKFHHLPFAAYSISEGRLSIGEIRRAAAQKLGVRESHRVKLLYKSRQLKDDAEAAGEEGLKQNSEITCVITDKTDDLSSSEDDSPSEREMENDRIEYQSDGRRANDGGARRTGRRQGKGKGKGKRDKGNPVSSPPYDSSQEYFPKAPQDSRDGSRLDPARSSSSTPNRRPSPIPPAPSPSVFDANLPASKPEPLAFKQIADLEKKLRTELAAPTEALLSDPPADAKKRDYECIRLTETIERDIILKTDAIDTEGRDDIRQKRKKLINEANSMLQRLDTAKKRWKGES